MNASIYGPLKVLHSDHAYNLALIARGHPSPPIHVQLIISDLCNQSCHFCSYRWDKGQSTELFHVIDNGKKIINPARFISTDKALEILDDCHKMGVKAIQFTGGGEPTVHRDHTKIFRHALDLGLDCSLVSNGVKWSEELISILPRFTWVRVSLDAGTAESYSKIRSVSETHYHCALSNVEDLVAAKKAAESDLAVGIGFVCTHENWSEVGLATQTAKELGVDNLRISAVFSTENLSYFDDFYEDASRACKKAAEQATDEFKVFNMFGDRISDLVQEHPNYPMCGYQFITTYIGGDLRVYRCCNTAYTTHGILGHISNQRFKEFWYSQETQRKLREFDPKTCDRCQFNDRNKLLNYALNHAPHVNFV